jgi:hypothetical protein
LPHYSRTSPHWRGGKTGKDTGSLRPLQGLWRTLWGSLLGVKTQLCLLLSVHPWGSTPASLCLISSLVRLQYKSVKSHITMTDHIHDWQTHKIIKELKAPCRPVAWKLW